MRHACPKFCSRAGRAPIFVSLSAPRIGGGLCGVQRLPGWEVVVGGWVSPGRVRCGCGSGMGFGAGLAVEQAAAAAGVGRNAAWGWLRAGGRGEGERAGVRCRAGTCQVCGAGGDRGRAGAGEGVPGDRGAAGAGAQRVDGEPGGAAEQRAGRRTGRMAGAGGRREERARRPKPARLAENGELRAWVQGKLEKNWSPEQISARLRAEFPGRAEMRVSHGDDLPVDVRAGPGGAAPGAGARTCGPGGRCAGPAGRRASGAGGSRAW